MTSERAKAAEQLRRLVREGGSTSMPPAAVRAMQAMKQRQVDEAKAAADNEQED